MALDTELMMNEFMHRFGNNAIALGSNLYTIAGIIKKPELIPEYLHKEYRGDFYRKLPKEYKDKFVERACRCYKVLEEVVEEVKRENEEYSPCFRLIQTFIEILKQPMSSFEKYLKLHKDDKDFKQAFSPYIPQLELAILCMDGIEDVSEIYDNVVDGTEARRRWLDKHPEF